MASLTRLVLPASNERTPLLRRQPEPPLGTDGEVAASSSWFPPLHRVYFTSFLGTMTFAVTQASLIYSFRTMTCDDYYTRHEWHGHGDRCKLPEIDSAKAKSIALMSTVTTTCSRFVWFI